MDCVGIVLKGVRKVKLCFETTRDLESWFCCVFYAICLCNSENVLVTLICRGSVMFLMAWQVGGILITERGACCSPSLYVCSVPGIVMEL